MSDTTSSNTGTPNSSEPTPVPADQVATEARPSATGVVTGPTDMEVDDPAITGVRDED